MWSQKRKNAAGRHADAAPSMDSSRPRSSREISRFLREQLQGLGVRPPLDVEEVCRALAKRRGRSLYLREAPLPKPGPSGVWAEYDDFDVILYQQATTRLHQEHIILHEVGHILMAEEEEGMAPAAEETEEHDPYVEGWATMLPVFDASLVNRVKQRCSYDDNEECSVELAATIIGEWADALEDVPPLSDDPATRRVEAALTERRGWL